MLLPCGVPAQSCRQCALASRWLRAATHSWQQRESLARPHPSGVAEPAPSLLPLRHNSPAPRPPSPPCPAPDPCPAPALPCAPPQTLRPSSPRARGARSWPSARPRRRRPTLTATRRRCRRSSAAPRWVRAPAGGPSPGRGAPGQGQAVRSDLGRCSDGVHAGGCGLHAASHDACRSVVFSRCWPRPRRLNVAAGCLVVALVRCEGSLRGRTCKHQRLISGTLCLPPPPFLRAGAACLQLAEEVRQVSGACQRHARSHAPHMQV